MNEKNQQESENFGPVTDKIKFNDLNLSPKEENKIVDSNIFSSKPLTLKKDVPKELMEVLDNIFGDTPQGDNDFEKEDDLFNKLALCNNVQNPVMNINDDRLKNNSTVNIQTNLTQAEKTGLTPKQKNDEVQTSRIHS